MQATSEDIKSILTDSSSALNLVFGVSLFIGKEPTTPNNTVTIFDTGGQPPGLTLDQKVYEHPAIQIRVRNISYMVGWGLISSIQDTLHGRAQETWNGTLYSLIYAVSNPMFLDWDDNGRARFVVNFNIDRRAV